MLKNQIVDDFSSNLKGDSVVNYHRQTKRVFCLYFHLNMNFGSLPDVVTAMVVKLVDDAGSSGVAARIKIRNSDRYIVNVCKLFYLNLYKHVFLSVFKSTWIT